MVKVSAPAKIIVGGEHSVVYGKPALAAAIDLRCTVDAEENNSIDGIAIVARDLAMEFTYDQESIDNLVEGKEIHNKFDNIAMAVLTAGRRKNISLTIRSDIPIGAGLGSSAAVSVATAAAILRLQDDEVDPNEVSRVAYEAEKIAHGTPSGIDNSTATFGGFIRFEEGSHTALTSSFSLPLLIINTKVPRDTKALVDRVGQLVERYPSIIYPVLDSMGELVTRLELAIQEENMGEIGELMNINQGLLEAIDVSHPMIEEIIQYAKNRGAVGAKLTGAGGGGCLIVMGRNEVHLEELSNSLEDKIKNIDIYQTRISKEGYKFE